MEPCHAYPGMQLKPWLSPLKYQIEYLRTAESRKRLEIRRHVVFKESNRMNIIKKTQAGRQRSSTFFLSLAIGKTAFKKISLWRRHVVFLLRLSWYSFLCRDFCKRRRKVDGMGKEGSKFLWGSSLGGREGAKKGYTAVLILISL